jgi:hypothetical protein
VASDCTTRCHDERAPQELKQGLQDRNHGDFMISSVMSPVVSKSAKCAGAIQIAQVTCLRIKCETEV